MNGPELAIKSMLLGLAIAAPLGPIGALCVNRSLERGFLAGVAGGLGTALADAVYASIAAIGFSSITASLASIATPLHILGGIFMLWLGCTNLMPGRASQAAAAHSRGLLDTMAVTFFLTITNPLTIIAFTALFAGLGLASTSDAQSAIWVVAGVFTGSMLWWILLSGSVSLAQRRLPHHFTHWTRRLSGILLIGFGLWALASVLFEAQHI